MCTPTFDPSLVNFAYLNALPEARRITGLTGDDMNGWGKLAMQHAAAQHSQVMDRLLAQCRGCGAPADGHNACSYCGTMRIVEAVG